MDAFHANMEQEQMSSMPPTSAGTAGGQEPDAAPTAPPPRPARDSSVARIICTDPALAARLRALMAATGDAEVIQQSCDCDRAPLCRWLDPDPLGPTGQVQATLYEAIETLERSRHAFRSREMGQLRQRLTRLLEDLAGAA